MHWVIISKEKQKLIIQGILRHSKSYRKINWKKKDNTCCNMNKEKEMKNPKD
jgi:hypothetical protein